MLTNGKVARFLMMVLASSIGCLAQNVSFGLSSGSGNPGSTVTLDVAMDTSSGTSPASVEWTINYPVSDFSSMAVTPGVVAAAANKSVSCTSNVGSSTCVLWGDNSIPMVNGVLATVSLVVSGSTQGTSSQLRLSVPISAAPSGFPLPTVATGGTVTILQPASISGFSCFPISLTPPATSTCTVQLSAAALSGGASVAVVASPTDVLIPSLLTIPQGSTSATFTVSPVSVAATTAINLTATYLAGSSGFGLTVNPPPSVLTSLSVNPGTLVGGQIGSGLLTLSSPAAAGGAVVSLLSSNVSAASLPASVTVVQGATTAAFTVQGGAVLAATPVIITGSYGTVNMTANLTVNPLPVILSSVSVNPSSMVGSGTSTGTITLSAPASNGGVTVSLSSSSSAVTVLLSVTVSQGSNTATFQVLTVTVTTPISVLITASYSGGSVTANLMVNPRPHALNGIQINPVSIQSGQSATGTVTLAASAGSGGVTVLLFSSNNAVVKVPTSVLVAEGATSAFFTATAGVVTNTTTVALTAFHAGLHQTTYLTVVRAHQVTYGHRQHNHGSPQEAGHRE